MITHAICLALATQSTFESDAKRAIAVAQSTQRSTATVKTSVKTASRTSSLKYVVKVIKPNTVFYEGWIQPLSIKEPTHRTVFVKDLKGIIYDHDLNEYQVRQLTNLPNLSQRLALGMDSIPDEVKFVIDPETTAGLLNPLIKLKGWKQTGTRQWSLRQGNSKEFQTTTITFDGKGRLSSTRFQQPYQSMGTSFAYGSPPTTVNFSVPKTAFKVASFVEYDPLPPFDNSATKLRFTSAIRFFDRLRFGTILANDDEGSTRIDVAMYSIAESTQRYQWTYDGSRLFAVDHRVRRGGTKAESRRSVISRLSTNNIPVTPITRKLLLKENPMRSYVSQDQRIRAVGTLTVLGSQCDILEAVNRSRRTSFTIRRSDGALLDVSTTHLDPRGQAITKTRLSLVYEGLGKAKGGIAKPAIPPAYAGLK